MIRLLYIVILFFIISTTISGIINNNLSGIASGKSLHGYTINFANNPIEYTIDIITRVGAIILLLFLIKKDKNSKKD